MEASEQDLYVLIHTYILNSTALTLTKSLMEVTPEFRLQQRKVILNWLVHTMNNWSKFHFHRWNYLKISNGGYLCNINTLSQ